MKKTLYVRPTQGLTIPNPATGKHLPAFGDAVDDGQYWRRRLRERSVESITREAVAKGRAEAEKTRLAAEAEAEKARLAAEAKASEAAAEAEAATADTKKGGK